jgi:two-component system LytT family sensor kinase
MRRRALQAAVLVAAWLPIGLFWMVLMVVYGHSSAAEALQRSALTIGTAALLGIAVWHFCLRRPWPHRMRAGFYVQQFVAASLYATVWVVSMYATEPLLSHTSMWSAFTSSHVLGWQLIMALWLYGVVAGVSYAIQTGRRAHDDERRALVAEAGLSTARLDAVRSRLHPHFLFNALHTVSALVRQDPAQAESAIEKLGDMLRYTLRETQGDTVPFAEEWEFTRRYLEFEQLRFGARLTVSTEIDPGCMSCSAPSFALQTLVENAVRHSIAMRPEGGRIDIKARTNEKNLLVRVRDDGTNGHSSPQDGSRFGLHALRERLDAVYGAESRLAVESDAAGFEVSFSVPRTRRVDVDEE